MRYSQLQQATLITITIVIKILIITIIIEYRLLQFCLLFQIDMYSMHIACTKSEYPYFFIFIITKTCLYNFDPLKPHLYIVKLGFTGVYIIFLISAQNINCGYSLEPPRRGGSNEYLQSMFWAEIWTISEFFIWKFLVFWRWNFLYIGKGVFS